MDQTADGASPLYSSCEIDNCRKELVALSDGYRGSAESWADLLRDANDH
ncbi:hypothetical protein [Nonomuraea sp. NPDC003201]